MTKAEALKLLETAPRGDGPSRLNPAFTQTEGLEIVRAGVASLKGDPLDSIMVKRVWQVVKNQKRPRY